MLMEIKAGFIDGDITYENWCWSETVKVYKEKMDQDFCFEFYNYHRSRRENITRIVGKNFFFASSGTIGKGYSPLFKWHLFLHPIGTKDECQHTIVRDAEGKLSFCDGDCIAHEAELRKHEAELRKEKQEQEEEQKQKEVDSILASALEQYQSTYDLIQDKEFFLEQVKEQIYLYRFDLEEREKSIVENFAGWVEIFLKGERELPAFIQDLTYESAVRIYPEITAMGVPENELRDAVESKLQWIKGEKSFGPWITEYKDEIFVYIEEEISGVLNEKQHLEKERKKEALKAKYSPAKLMEMYSAKLSEYVDQEKSMAFFEKLPEEALRWTWDFDEDAFLQRVEREIDNFSRMEQMKKEAEEFCATWGSDTKFIELTEEKKARFAEVEAGTCADIELVNEYDLYCKLRADYEELIYRKSKKGLRPTFVAIPAYFAYFCQIIEFAKKYALIDEEGNFSSWDNFDGFKRAVKKYERSLDKSK